MFKSSKQTCSEPLRLWPTWLQGLNMAMHNGAPRGHMRKLPFFFFGRPCQGWTWHLHHVTEKLKNGQYRVTRFLIRFLLFYPFSRSTELFEVGLFFVPAASCHIWESGHISVPALTTRKRVAFWGESGSKRTNHKEQEGAKKKKNNQREDDCNNPQRKQPQTF